MRARAALLTVDPDQQRKTSTASASRTTDHALLWIEENRLGQRNLPDDQRAGIALRVMQQRTALALSERNKTAIEKRWSR